MNKIRNRLAGFAGILSLTAMWAPGAFSGDRAALDFFTQAPDSITVLLPKNTRLDMADYFRSGLATPSTNGYDGKSVISYADDSRVCVKISDRSTIEMAVLPGKDTVIAVIETVATPVHDSGIRFYRSSGWKLLASPTLTSADFLTDEGRKSRISPADMPSFLFISAEYNPDENVFVFTNNTDSAYYGKDDTRPAGLKYLQHSISLRFDGKRLVKVPEK